MAVSEAGVRPHRHSYRFRGQHQDARGLQRLRGLQIETVEHDSGDNKGVRRTDHRDRRLAVETAGGKFDGAGQDRIKKIGLSPSRVSRRMGGEALHESALQQKIHRLWPADGKNGILDDFFAFFCAHFCSPAPT